MVDARYQAALDYIYSFVDYERVPRPRDAANYDLRRVDELLARVGDPHRKVKSVHVAGSKGKGSVASMVTAVLTMSGYRTGLFTSPHLIVFNERIRIDGEMIPDQDVTRLVDRLKPEVTAVNEAAHYGRLTTFEVITALGFMYFAEKRCDFQVIEVGLGGRLDATNVIMPEVAAITSISLEHTDVLGNTLALIAGEKAGIIKPGAIVVSAPQADEAREVFERTCRERKAKLVQTGVDITWQTLHFDNHCQTLRIKGRLGTYEVTVPLLGEYQLENTAVAVGVLEVLMEKGFHVTSESIASGLAGVSWPGRLQVLNQRPLVVVDGAHNPYSASHLREALKRHFEFDKATLIIGTSADKDINGIAAELAPLFNRVIITRSIHPRALATAPLVDAFARLGMAAEATDDISTALPVALAKAGPDDLICVAGSLFVVAGAIEQAGILGLKP